MNQIENTIQKYEGKGVIIPFEYFQMLAAFYFGNTRSVETLKFSGMSVAIESALFGKMLLAWYGKGETHAQEYPPAEEESEGVGEQEDVMTSFNPNLDDRVFKPGGRLARQVANAD